MLSSPIYDWNQQNVSQVPKSSGVYVLFDTMKVCIYIGSSNNLNNRLTGYLNSNFSDDPCKRDTEYFQIEASMYNKTREQELLKEFKNRYGKLPKCNDVMP